MSLLMLQVYDDSRMLESREKRLGESSADVTFCRLVGR